MAGIRTGPDKLTLVLALFCAPLAAQKPLSLHEIPSYAGRRILVRGVVNSPAIRLPDGALLSIEEGSSAAIVRVGRDDSRLEPFRPGDALQIDGTVEMQGEVPVILPTAISKIGVKPAPAAIEVPVNDLAGPRYLGRLVSVHAESLAVADGQGGAILSLDANAPFAVFVPSPARHGILSVLRTGDPVYVTGIAFAGNYRMLVPDAAHIVRLPPNLFAANLALGGAILMMLLIAFLIWSRERRIRKQRERLRKTYHLGEEILGATSAESIVRRLRESLPEILEITDTRLFVHNRTGNTLDSIAAEGEKPVSYPVSAPAGDRSPAVAWCFHYNSPLAIPDPGRSPFMVGDSAAAGAPKSLLLVPMFAQGRVVGVLELDRHDRARDFTEFDQELAQHLANQAAVAIRLAEQRNVQEQLFRTEKLAAVGRLISGVVDELRAPLESIQDLAARALGRRVDERDLTAIQAEAARASSIVTRLVSYASAEQGSARPVQVVALLRRLIEFREADWKASGIRARDLTTREPIAVLGSEGQLEQVFLNLFVHAEQALAESSQKVISIRTSVLAKRLLVEIAYTGGSVAQKAVETAAVLGVTRSVIGGHGGEVRLIEKSNTDPRFEVELPIASRERAQGAAAARTLSASRRLTTLVIDNDESTQRQILALLSASGSRVVPVDNADSGLDLAHRMRFDVAFCSVHAPGLNWVELSERMRSVVRAFVLVSDRHDSELAADFEGDGRFVVSKPVEEADLVRVIEYLEPPLQIVKNRLA
jgi:GAF domain-containing protein